MDLKKKSSLILVFFVPVLLVGVLLVGQALLLAASAKLAISWRNPRYTGGEFKNILVLALDGKAANRAEFEDELVAAISRPGVQASPSYEFLPRPDATPIKKDDLRWVVRKQKFDGIVVSRLTKNDTKTTYVPGETTYVPVPYYDTFYGYYDALYPVVYSPGYLETEKIAQVEVNVYATGKPEGELVWTGTTNTFDSSSVMKRIKELTKLVTTELEKQNLIPPQSK